MALLLAMVFAVNSLIALVIGVSIGPSAYLEMLGFGLTAAAATVALGYVVRLLHRALDDSTTRH
jgi:VIT1/CCC1 family predicted Fe2+/Mn2+ transporter